ncbi:hypothetical protein ABBQ38_003394 [Trebouxia sp. C0009 RCD-2024]
MSSNNKELAAYIGRIRHTSAATAVHGREQGTLDAGIKDQMQELREERRAAAEQGKLLQETLQNVLQATSAQQQQKMEEQKYQNRIVGMVQAHSDLLDSAVKGAMSGNPAVFCTALFRHQASQNEEMQKRLEVQLAAADASAHQKKRSDEALRLEQEERAAAVAAANSHSARADCLDKKLQAAQEALEASVQKTKLLAELLESKAQACAAAEAGQREALQQARNIAVAHDQSVVQRQADQEASAQRIEALERLVESKTQACEAAEARPLHALARESGSIAVRNMAFQKLKAAEEKIKNLMAERKADTTPELSLALGAANNQLALLTQELDDQKKVAHDSAESMKKKRAAEVTRLQGSLSSGKAQAERVTALQHELAVAQQEAAAANEANRQAAAALAQVTHVGDVAEEKRRK